MNVNIDVNISGENGGQESFRVILNQDELTNLVKTEGVSAANKALDSFVDKLVSELKTKLSTVINR